MKVNYTSPASQATQVKKPKNVSQVVKPPQNTTGGTDSDGDHDGSGWSKGGQVNTKA